MSKRMLYLFWLPIILAIIGLASAVIVAVIGKPPTPDPSSTSPTFSSNRFDYQVRVETKIGDPIANAVVRLEIGGIAPLDSVSDSAGLARIFIAVSYLEKPGRLIVKATGYKAHTQNIDLLKDDLPKVVQLDHVP